MWSRGSEIVQPVSTAAITEALQTEGAPEEVALSERTVRDRVADLETMGLVETWIDSRGREGRVKQVETTFDPQWVWEAIEVSTEDSPHEKPLDDERDG